MSEAVPSKTGADAATHHAELATTSIAARNLTAEGVANAAPFVSPEEHLRAEVWRVWLRVEYEIRRRWEFQSLPATQQEGTLGLWQPREINGLFTQAHATYAGAPAGGDDHASRQLLDAYLRHSALLEARIERTLAAGVRLPFIELVRIFSLDARQRATLTLALAAEIDVALPVALRYLTNDPMSRHVNGQVLAMLVYDTLRTRADLARDLSPRSPLVFYRLLEIDDSAARHDATLHRRIRPAGRLMMMLEGAEIELDAELEGLARLVQLPTPGLFAEDNLAAATAALGNNAAVFVIAQGQPGIGKRTLLATAAARSGHRLLEISSSALASRPAATTTLLLQALAREAKLLQAIPTFVDLDDALTDGAGTDAPDFVTAMGVWWDGPIGVTVYGDQLPRFRGRPVVQLSVSLPDRTNRQELWMRGLPKLAASDAITLAERYAITGGIINLATRAACATHGKRTPSVDDLDFAVQAQLHGRLQRLGKKIETPYTFDDIVTDDDTLAALREVVAAISERRRVREEWGLRGSDGISVLFSGSPGVGKSMSATVIAKTLGLAVYEIDLSQVMSKWIGETEKNLAEVFDAAEPGHVVLLFNEADSLFGKRTAEASTANDRYANIGVNYLLQRLERFGGVSILTTNLTKSIDQAFRRRFAYDVQFTFPSIEIRAELWARAFPEQAHIENIDPQELAERYELSGGYVKVAVQRAALVASVRGSAITMDILTETIDRMYRERGKLSAVGRLE